MQSTPRPLPGAPLNPAFAHSTENRLYRPLPAPPVQSTNIPFIKGLCPHTPPTPASSSAGSSDLLLKPRPRLRISVKSPTLRRRNSLDSLTVRTPALRDPGQTLAPVVHRWNNSVTSDRSLSRRAPHNFERSSRVSSTNSFDSPLVFKRRTATIEPSISELLEEDGRRVLISRVSRPENGIFDRGVTLRPPRLQSILIKDRTRTNFPAATTRAVTYLEEDSDEETTGPNPYSVSSIDLTNGREFCVNGRKSWRSLLNAAKVAMISRLSRGLKPQPTKSAVGAKRVSQLPTPLHRTWYKERSGWRWVERDVGEVLTELRRLQ